MKNNNWISNGNCTAWPFYYYYYFSVKDLVFCKGFFCFSCKDFTLRGFPALTRSFPRGKDPGGTPCLAHTYGSSSRPCRPGSP